MRALMFLLSINPNNGMTKNADTINYLSYILKSGERDRVFEHFRYDEDFLSIKSKVNMLLFKKWKKKDSSKGESFMTYLEMK